MLRFAVRTLALLLSTAPLAIAQSACQCTCLKDGCWSLLQGPAFFPSQSVVDDCRSFVYTTSYYPPSTTTETTFITSTATAESTSTETSFLPGPTMTTTVAAVTVTSTVTAGGGGGGAKLMVRDGMEKVRRQARALPSYASGVCSDGPAYASACACIVAAITSQVIFLDATTTDTARATGTVTDVIINLNVEETTVTGTYVYVTSGTTTITQTVTA
ncbi:hypothetical protein AA313_de0203208 [Arthrobotrys entomopaga]|nr:hypothetical protein AA313_de0203208 [Arthrobotrys entomopaga]